MPQLEHFVASFGPVWTPGAPLSQIVFRTIVVYAFLVVVFRLAGRRTMGQMNVFDLALILVVSNAVQNAMVGPDTSLLGGLVAATTLIVLNYGFARVEARSPKARKILEGSPTLLIHDGRWLHDNLKRENLTVDEIKQAMREHGVVDPAEVKLAVLELDGSISIVPTGSDIKRSHRLVRAVHHPS